MHRAGIAVITMFLVWYAAAGTLAVVQNEPAPRLRGKLLSTEQREVHWDEGSLTLVNFWASWCAPCATEMPELQRWQDLWAADGFRVFGVTKDIRREEALLHAQLDQLGVKYPNFFPGDVISRTWGGVGTLPTSFLIDADGIVIGRYVGGSEEILETMRKRIAEHLGVDDPGPASTDENDEFPADAAPVLEAEPNRG